MHSTKYFSVNSRQRPVVDCVSCRNKSLVVLGYTGFGRKVVIIGIEGSCSGGATCLVLAPKEQHVYSPKFLIYPAPLGAECNLEAQAHSAPLERTGIGFVGYKHGAPLEHCALRIHAKTTFRAKLVVRLYA